MGVYFLAPLQTHCAPPEEDEVLECDFCGTLIRTGDGDSEYDPITNKTYCYKCSERRFNHD